MSCWHSSFVLLVLGCTLFQPLFALVRQRSEDALSNPTATLPGGQIVGTATTISSSTVTVNQFLGVPFAKPPTRFSAPEVYPPWSSALTVTAQPPACVQQFNGKDLCEVQPLNISNVYLDEPLSSPLWFLHVSSTWCQTKCRPI